MNINTKKGPIFDPGVCRCCGEIKKCRLLNIEYEWRGQKEIYSDMFVDCFGLLLSHLDGEYLERLICATCVSRLREASSFREQVLQCEEKLLTTKIHDEDSPNTNVKEESKVKEELDSIQNDYQDDVTLEYHDNGTDYIKDEAIVIPKRKSLRQKLKAAKKVKTVEKDDVLTKQMLYNAQRLKKKLKAIDNPNTKVKEESKVKEELDSIQNDYQDDVTLEYLDNDTDFVEDEALVKPKRKSLRRKLKAAKKVKTVKKDDVLTKQMSYDAQRLKKELKDEMQDIELPEQSTQQHKQNGYKTNENSKSYQNFVTIVENSYACPFDTSFSDFFCVYCRQVFTDPYKLREHSMTHDPSTLKNVLLNTTSNKKLQIDIYRIDCRLCSENIDDLEKFTDHIKSIHQKTYHHNSDNFLKYRLTSAPPSCTECGATFSFFHALKKHMAEHFGTCICDMCGAHYFEERMLILHQKTHQKVEESFACKECGKTFKSKYTRYIHIARTHKKEAAYQCNTCDELFFSYTLRYRHMIKVHGEERTFKCEKCDRVYDSRKSLREHNRRFHLKILKHHCDLCDKRFYLPSRLKEHMASHTGERNFRCEYCGKSYPRLRGLKVHMQSHSSEKKFKCELCNASFVQNINLKNHVKRQHQSVEMEGNYNV